MIIIINYGEKAMTIFVWRETLIEVRFDKIEHLL